METVEQHVSEGQALKGDRTKPGSEGRATREYTVRIDAFEGPLDLLLFLIRRAEVEIHDIPIAAITEQYIAYLEQITSGEATTRRRIDIEQAGEFLVMAATLMEIKSRMLVPNSKASVLGEDATADRPERQTIDPRSELVRQLLEYKRYRDATDRLEEWRTEWEHRYPSARVVTGRSPPAAPTAEELAATDAEPVAEERVDVDDLQLIDLVEAFARVVESVDFSRVGEHRVVMDDTPVEVHGERIVQRLRDALAADSGPVRFDSLFVNRTRGEMIGLFLAILEMVKQQRVLVEQDAASSEIVLKLGAGADAAPIVVTSVSAAAVSAQT